MGIFRMTIAGRASPVLVKAAGLREAKDRIITASDALNAEEMELALTNGETVWREGEPFPADPAVAETGDAGDNGDEDKGPDAQ